jgi:hypothetical protein
MSPISSRLRSSTMRGDPVWNDEMHVRISFKPLAGGTSVTQDQEGLAPPDEPQS